MKQVHYIDKTFPITLQDLLDLARSKNLDPRDLKLIMNSNQADLSSYVQCALLNQDCDKISIELYTEASDGLHEDIQLKTKENPIKVGHTIEAYHILDRIYDMTRVDINVINPSDLDELNHALQIIKAFYGKQQPFNKEQS